MSNETAAAKVALIDNPYRVLKVGTGPSLSGKSTRLTWQIGCTPEQQIVVRICDSTGKGMYSSQWIAFEAINQALAKAPAGEAVTSVLLHPLYAGKSVNTPSFLFAALLHEGLVEPSKTKKRQYDRVSDAQFVATIRKLMDSGVSLEVDKPKAHRTVPKSENETSKPDAKPVKGNKKLAPVEAKKVSAIEVPTFLPQASPIPDSNLEPAMPAKKTKARAKK